MTTEETELRREPTTTEKVKNVCIGLGALTGLLLGFFAFIKGEPVAEKTWTTLRDQVNMQSDAINKLHSRVIFLQAHEEGRTAATLQTKVDALQKELDDVKRVALAVKVAPATTRPACTEGQLLDDVGKCRFAPKTAIDKVRKETKRADTAVKAFAEEQKKRRELELKKRDLMQKMLELSKSKSNPALQSLPAKLEDAKN